MTNTVPAAPPALTTAEKVAALGAALGAAFVLGVLIAIPVTRVLLADSLVSTARFIADTAVQGARGIWLFIESVFGAGE